MTKINTIAYCRNTCVPVTITCELEPGIGMHVLGMSNKNIKECLLRTVTALVTLGFKVPGKRVVISITPGIEGDAALDLPLALALLYECKFFDAPKHPGQWTICGELGLDGSVREVLNPVNRAVLSEGIGLILPKESAMNLHGLGLNEDEIYGVSNINDALSVMSGVTGTFKLSQSESPMEPLSLDKTQDVNGVSAATLRALMIAAVGNHDMTIIGPEGSGKDRLAQILADLCPDMTRDETLEMLCNSHESGRTWNYRPMVRLDHNSAGIYDLCLKAHHGVLCLSDFPKISSQYMTALKQIHATGEINEVTCAGNLRAKADFQIVQTANTKKKHNDELLFQSATRKGIQITITPPGTDYWKLDDLRNCILAAKQLQSGRGQQTSNSKLGMGDIVVDETLNKKLNEIINKTNLMSSCRTEILRIARSIADLDRSKDITIAHIAEATGYQFLNKIKN